MKKYIFLSVIIFIGFVSSIAQKFEKHIEISFYTGYQNPIENPLNRRMGQR